MAEKVKAKKAKAPSKKASPKARKSETAVKQEEETAPVIKRNKTGKILAKSAQETVSEELETNEALAADDDADELPPLEQKFTASESVIVRETPKAPAVAPVQDNSEQLRVKLSKSLVRKLREQAADEGIGLDEFVTELLSESVVLRAWEIVERKNQMKGGQPMGNGRGNGPNGPQQNRNNNNNSNGQGHRGNKGHRGMNHSRYQTIMEDKGAFMEYVRGQERNRR
jgi:predicted HicB family RNase H-like nuclease